MPALPLALAIPCAKPFTQRCRWLPVHEYVPKGLSCLPATGIIVSSDGLVGMNTLHSVSLAWCVAETARSGPKAPSPNDRQREIERKEERDERKRERTGGAQRENPRIGEGAPAMVIIWTVTDTDSFPPGADQGQTVSSWGA